MRVRYIKLRIRTNVVTCLENSPLLNKLSKPRAIGINFISIMGYDATNLVGSIERALEDYQN